MRILGIDPGIAIVGWGVVDFERSTLRAVDYGSITTTPDMTIESRIAAVYHGMQNLFDAFHPDAMAVEELFFNTNQKTGIIVAEARGVILLNIRPCRSSSPSSATAERKNTRSSPWSHSSCACQSRPSPTIPPTRWQPPLPTPTQAPQDWRSSTISPRK